MAFSLLPEPNARESTEPPPTPIAIPKEEIKKVIGRTTVTAAIAKEPTHWPTKMVSTKILTDINKIPTEEGMACLISSFLISCVPNSSEVTAISDG
ncbi:hypothetical protein D3C72_1243890 [compost metagenome]